MTDMEKIIKGVHDARRYLEDREWVDKSVGAHINALNDAISLLKEQDAFEQKQIFVKEGHSKIVQIICPCCGKKIGCDISVDTEGR